ncbi:MAG: hypothetical protein Q4G69_05980 [Planctomycetia bacterium]|nr:hypothetical protein [Planctomycetia bacterium]
MFSLLKLFKISHAPTDQERSEAINQHVEKTVASVSKGNVALRNGTFFTAKDLIDLHKRNMAHDFINSK